ncbi:hypothetical protein PFISCL1PPCAC_7951, partial [Pristionchus fissidentatus]
SSSSSSSHASDRSQRLLRNQMSGVRLGCRGVAGLLVNERLRLLPRVLLCDAVEVVLATVGRRELLPGVVGVLGRGSARRSTSEGGEAAKAGRSTHRRETLRSLRGSRFVRLALLPLVGLDECLQLRLLHHLCILRRPLPHSLARDGIVEVRLALLRLCLHPQVLVRPAARYHLQLLRLRHRRSPAARRPSERSAEAGRSTESSTRRPTEGREASASTAERRWGEETAATAAEWRTSATSEAGRSVEEAAREAIGRSAAGRAVPAS